MCACRRAKPRIAAAHLAIVPRCAPRDHTVCTVYSACTVCSACTDYPSYTAYFSRSEYSVFHWSSSVRITALSACGAPSCDAVQQAVEHEIIVKTVVHVYLRVEEDLRTVHPVSVRMRKVVEHQIGEVLAGAQHTYELIVQIEEGLLIVEPVVGA